MLEQCENHRVQHDLEILSLIRILQPLVKATLVKHLNPRLHQRKVQIDNCLQNLRGRQG